MITLLVCKTYVLLCIILYLLYEYTNVFMIFYNQAANASENAPLPPEEVEEWSEKPPSPFEPDPDSVVEKNDRIEASIRKREEEVRVQKAVYEKDRQKERGIHLHEKAVQHFKALLADMVSLLFYAFYFMLYG